MEESAKKSELLNKPLVSIIVPYYDDIKYLPVCIESILNQTYENFELVLLNHVSTDGSDIVAQSYNDIRIKHVNMEKNLGAGSTLLMIEFLKIAQGKYVKTFCADDIMLPDCLETLVSYMEENPEKDFVFGDMNYVDKDAKSLNITWSEDREGFDFNHDERTTLSFLFEGRGLLPYPAAMLKKDILSEAHLDRTFIMLVDMSIWASLLGKGKKIGFVNKSVVDYRIHDLQMCSIKNHKTVNTRSYYESMAYCNIFYKINDIPMVKFICKTFPFNKKVLAGDEKYIPFIVAYTYLKSRVSSYQISGYLKIHELFSDDEMRQEIENKFGFGIKEFREIYSKPRLCNADKKPNLVKQCILLLINFLNILSLGYLKKKKKKTLRPM